MSAGVKSVRHYCYTLTITQSNCTVYLTEMCDQQALLFTERKDFCYTKLETLIEIDEYNIPGEYNLPKFKQHEINKLNRTTSSIKFKLA